MRCNKLSSVLLVLAQIFFQPASGLHSPSGFESDLDDSVQEEESSKQQQQGSWSRWWSYDGISGPDYWNINKRWQLCSSGRKQSPVDLATGSLVYDHLLGPIRLDWLPTGVSIDEAERAIEARIRQAKEAGQLSSTGRQFNQSGHQEEDIQRQANQATVRARLLNSGRGFEVWLEGGQPSKAAQPGKEANPVNPADQLILSAGPLSYAYKLFKLELHSAPGNKAPSGGRRSLALSRTADSAEPAYLSLGERPTFSEQADPDLDPDPDRSSPGARSSEHQIDGRSFDGELQLHFYNKHLAGSANQALLMADEGLSSSASLFAVVSVFIIAQTSSNGRQRADQHPMEFDFLFNNLPNVPGEADSVELNLSQNQIDSLVPDRQQYVTYQGSLNKPPCSESVDWILTNKPLRISADKFQRLFAPNLRTSQDNVRPIKPLHRRLLRTTINKLALVPPVVAPSQTGPNTDTGDCLTNLQNCSRSALKQAAPLDNGGGGWKSALKERDKCSMKPKYAYQLSESFKR